MSLIHDNEILSFTADYKENIFSDTASKAGRYQRFAIVWALLALIYFICILVPVLMGTIDLNAFYDPKALYLTPGLWDLTGADFWTAFLFETPFALMRGISWLFEPVMLLLCVYFVVRAYLESKKIMKKDLV